MRIEQYLGGLFLVLVLLGCPPRGRELVFAVPVQPKMEQRGSLQIWRYDGLAGPPQVRWVFPTGGNPWLEAMLRIKFRELDGSVFRTSYWQYFPEEAVYSYVTTAADLENSVTEVMDLLQEEPPSLIEIEYYFSGLNEGDMIRTSSQPGDRFYPRFISVLPRSSAELDTEHDLSLLWASVWEVGKYLIVSGVESGAKFAPREKFGSSGFVQSLDSAVSTGLPPIVSSSVEVVNIQEGESEEAVALLHMPGEGAVHAAVVAILSQAVTNVLEERFRDRPDILAGMLVLQVREPASGIFIQIQNINVLPLAEIVISELRKLRETGLSADQFVAARNQSRSLQLSPYQAAGSAADAMVLVALESEYGQQDHHYAGIGALDVVEARTVNGLLQKDWKVIRWSIRADQEKVDESVLLRLD